MLLANKLHRYQKIRKNTPTDAYSETIGGGDAHVLQARNLRTVCGKNHTVGTVRSCPAVQQAICRRLFPGSAISAVVVAFGLMQSSQILSAGVCFVETHNKGERESLIPALSLVAQSLSFSPASINPESPSPASCVSVRFLAS